MTSDPFIAREVTFKHTEPARVSEHVRIFGVTPTFGQPETSVVLDAKVLSLRTRDAQPSVVTYLDAYARDVLAKLPVDDDLITQVERTIVHGLTRGVVDMQAVATQLGMSARTLQRRLAESETTFQVLVDGVRKRVAERYLADDKLSLGEIAFLVGFSDPSNFHRAYRRWTGRTPAAAREGGR